MDQWMKEAIAVLLDEVILRLELLKRNGTRDTASPDELFNERRKLALILHLLGCELVYFGSLASCKEKELEVGTDFKALVFQGGYCCWDHLEYSLIRLRKAREELENL